MKKEEIMLIIGIVLVLMWLGFVILTKDEKRKNVIIIGILIDIILIFISRNFYMLLIGLIGGLLCGLIPNFGKSVRKYNMAVKEMNGVKNWLIVSIIFFVMMFMMFSIIYPNIKVVLN